MKLSILSGTFNPIHNAHLALAQYVREKFDYDELLVIPAYNPPFKSDTASPADRLKMVELALKDYPQLRVCDIEYRSEEKSYSIVTVKKLYKEYNIDGKIGFITGTDAFADLDKWYKADELKTLVDFIVFERGLSFEDNKVILRQNEGFNMLRAGLPFFDISSTEIRRKILCGESVSEYLPKEVERYILENGLYK